MEVRIGVQNANRELTIDADLDVEAIQDLVEKALGAGGVLALSDARGRRVVVPADKLAYVDIATGVTGQVGFRS
ncbi:MAG TPA: DUF3107 domain-containing protein [Marmoricola sp.]|jgi:hypothetical protein|nr:DUF3107 domain-containing protein [Marmoricola sp.]